MKYGFCSNIKFIMDGDEKSGKIFDAIAKSGFEYLETQMYDVVDLDKAKYAELKKRLADSGIGISAGMLLFPRDLPLVSDEMDINKIKECATKVMDVSADLGTEMIVFGNGGGRKVKEGMDFDKCYKKMQEIVAAVDPIAGKYKIKIAVEPLCGKETNMINSVQEAVDLVKSVGAVNVGSVCDWYHVRMDNRTMDDLVANKDKVFHLHIAYPNGRKMPTSEDDMSEYTVFVDAVKKIGYNGKLSIEGNAGEVTLERFKDSLATLKKLFG